MPRQDTPSTGRTVGWLLAASVVVAAAVMGLLGRGPDAPKLPEVVGSAAEGAWTSASRWGASWIGVVPPRGRDLDGGGAAGMDGAAVVRALVEGSGVAPWRVVLLCPGDEPACASGADPAPAARVVMAEEEEQALREALARLSGAAAAPGAGWVLLVDAGGRLRGQWSYTGPDGLRRIAEGDALARGAETLASLERMPAWNALLNAGAAFLLGAGWFSIKRRRVGLHALCQIAALCVSVVFLASYLYYHHHAGSVPFHGPPALRWLYYAILITHAVLASVVVPLAAATLILALRQRFERHRALARWAWPIWMYVSVTGVVIYVLLYTV